MSLLNTLKLEWSKLEHSSQDALPSVRRNAFLYRHYAALHREVIGFDPWEGMTEFPYCIWKSGISESSLQRQRHVDSYPVYYDCITNLPRADEVLKALDPLFFDPSKRTTNNAGQVYFSGRVNVKVLQFHLKAPKHQEIPRLEHSIVDRLNAASNFREWWRAYIDVWVSQACLDLDFPLDHPVVGQAKEQLEQRMLVDHLWDTKVHFQPISKSRILPKDHIGVEVAVRCIAMSDTKLVPLWWHAGCYRQQFNSEPTLATHRQYPGGETQALHIGHWMIQYSSRGIQERAREWYAIHQSLFDGHLQTTPGTSMSSWASDILRENPKNEAMLSLPFSPEDFLDMDVL